ncbi:cation transport protein ChaC [Arboricoccus pini]|uniref:glutathione-specific gamma-glutamylcyclotransferase n=1 Tax=Arboricoccus pini TaxID=1963835 RepID=A0A212Q5S3_9PROT|nr:gamma-glutamylcyclotransferase [Arboricoccus pini]SNB54718.1 cation transport protein ChaC [Arboricoccus pini]
MTTDATDGFAWFFGYGSLMWNPGFPADAFEVAELVGWQRRFCIASRHYRGTPELPGLVLGLAPGGQCTGRALGVSAEREAEVLDYLDAREQVGGIYVYDRLKLPLRLPSTDRHVEAWCYVSRPDHEDFAGNLDLGTIATIIEAASGVAGSNVEYMENTVRHLRELGIVEPELETLLKLVERRSSGTR